MTPRTHFLKRITLARKEIPDPDSFPFNLPVVRNLDTLELHPQVNFLVGENGSGKSTLLEAIAVSLGFNPEGGTKNFRFATRESHSNLADYLRIAQGAPKPRTGFFLRAESLFNVATEIERLDREPRSGPPIIGAYGGRSLHEQSHGEAFLSLMTNRFGGNGLYLLDEPEAALSPARQLAVLTLISDLVGNGSQFLIATHSPILLGFPNSRIFQCSETGLEQIDYEDTDHFRITRDFLNDRGRMLRMLLS